MTGTFGQDPEHSLAMWRPAGDGSSVFALSPVAALAMAGKVERAVLARFGKPDPLIAALARLEAIRAALHDMKPVGHEATHLEEILAHAHARIEEWKA